MSTSKRVLTYLVRDGRGKEKANFSECILHSFDPSGASEMCLSCSLEDDKLILTESESSSVAIAHPPHCPVHLLQDEQMKEISPDVLDRGVDVGVAILLWSSDKKLLLTRRASHLRTFPGIWVPPGGHVELGETLAEAGLREVKEEIGLSLSTSQCHPQPVALWESVYPPMLSWGLPRRHHVVVYYAVTLPETHQTISTNLNLDPEEVDVAAWFDESVAMAIASRNDAPQKLASWNISAISSDPANRESPRNNIPVSSFFSASVSPGQKGEWFSAGTSFAIREWCQRCSKL